MNYWSRVNAIILALAVFSMPAAVTSLRAQETKSPSILEFFGFEPRQPKASPKKPALKNAARKKKVPKKPVAGRKKTPSNSKPAELSQPASAAQLLESGGLPALPEKLPNAKIILVVGDFMADGVSEGIEKAFENDAGIIVVSKANGSSGFIRDDFYDWTKEIAGIVTETRPAVVTVMIGTNDRQPLRLNGEKAVVRSPEWTAEYQRRVAKFSDAVKTTGVPLVWIGMPPFKQPSMSADMLALNDIYQRNTERVSGEFVDIWDGFLDEQGTFSINGSDYIGQPARLRASDGINLTFPGKRKAAFFAEKSLRLALGEVQASGLQAFSPFNLPGPKQPSVSTPINITRIAPISLFDPVFDGDTELLGGAESATINQNTKSLSQKLYVDGIVPDALANINAAKPSVTP